MAADVAPPSWQAWRGHFRATNEVIYLDTSSHGLQSDRLAEALTQYLEDWAVEAPWETLWHRAVQETLGLFAALIRAPAPAVALMPSVTAAFQGVLSALPRETGRREVVISAREWVSLRHVLAAWGELEPVVVPAHLRPDDEAFLAYVGAHTALVVASHVCYRSGYRTDLARLSERARACGALVFVDAFQSAGVVPIDAPGSGVDFLAAGALKYLLGAPGAAFLYVRPELSERLRPSLTGWRGQAQPMRPELSPAPGAQRFMGGTWPVPSVYAARAGLQLLFEAGPERVAERVADLVGHFQGALDARRMVTSTPSDPLHRASVVTLVCEAPDAVHAQLHTRGVRCSVREDGLRFSFHAYNTEEEVEAVVHLLEATLCRRSPYVH